MSKLMLVAAGALGYVFGARAGKQRYTQIKSKVTEIWQNPKVQAKKEQAQEYAKDKAPQLQEKISSVTSKAATQGKRAANRQGTHDTTNTDNEADTTVTAGSPDHRSDSVAEPAPMTDGLDATSEHTHG